MRVTKIISCIMLIFFAATMSGCKGFGKAVVRGTTRLAVNAVTDSATNDNQPTDMYAWCGRHRAALGINYFPIKQIGVKAEFSYGILKNGVRADGTRGKLYNDEPQVAVGIVYAGFYKLDR